MEQTQLTDPAGYAKRQHEIDAAILKALESGGKTRYELGEMLRQMGVGNARYNEQLEISYSSTGAITRSATTSLRHRGYIHDSWDKCHMQTSLYERPYRWFLNSPPDTEQVVQEEARTNAP